MKVVFNSNALRQNSCHTERTVMQKTHSGHKAQKTDNTLTTVDTTVDWYKH